MSLLERLLSIGSIRKMIWRMWYPFLTKRLQSADVCFLNYAFESDPPVDLELDPKDESDRACIQLYHHVASQIKIDRLDVLEVSCGHGGGASWITRTMKPKSYVGLDLNPKGIAFCEQRHQINDLKFIQGDAQKLPFPDASLDAVVNVEASHCYPDFAGFLKEVSRVLKPGGHFLYADFRFSDQFCEWEADVQNAGPLTIVSHRDIGSEVLRGMNCNADRSRTLVLDHLPKALHAVGQDFAGVPDSKVYDALESGELSYRSWNFQKLIQ